MSSDTGSGDAPVLCHPPGETCRSRASIDLLDQPLPRTPCARSGRSITANILPFRNTVTLPAVCEMTTAYALVTAVMAEADEWRVPSPPGISTSAGGGVR